ncbi:hypothetical protein AB0I84_50115, partial [Streptomyces spectabilis]|uniref:hypothetical protein n=1 Tax=Streptomyces spectabilis TaxID=68270 RepID=UPI0033EF950A
GRPPPQTAAPPPQCAAHPPRWTLSTSTAGTGVAEGFGSAGEVAASAAGRGPGRRGRKAQR